MPLAIGQSAITMLYTQQIKKKRSGAHQGCPVTSTGRNEIVEEDLTKNDGVKGED